MRTLSIEAALGATSYPGRGILLGRSADGAHAVVVYFIMGRSENSRNRVFERTPDGVRTRAHDESRMRDPSLIIYAPVRATGAHTVVTNGDQTDTIVSALVTGGTFESALRTREYEPDAPNWTPRVSGIVTLRDGGFSYRLALLKALLGADGKPVGCLRFFYEYETPAPGLGHFLHTYRSDGDPLPPFEGEPEPVALDGADIDDTCARVWAALDPDNRVSLFVRYLTLQTGEAETRVVNRHA